jgi:hypothetical protein
MSNHGTNADAAEKYHRSPSPTGAGNDIGGGSDPAYFPLSSCTPAIILSAARLSLDVQ